LKSADCKPLDKAAKPEISEKIPPDGGAFSEKSEAGLWKRGGGVMMRKF